MGWLNVEKPSEKWSASYFKMFVERIRTAINYLDSENFPDGLSGAVLTSRSVSLATKVTGYGGLVIPNDFFALFTPVTISDETLFTFGSSVLWSPTWKTFAKVYFEVTCAAADANYPCTIEVHGVDGALISEEITDPVLQRYEWEIIAANLPAVGMTWVFKSMVEDSAYPLTILSARIILKLTESV